MKFQKCIKYFLILGLLVLYIDASTQTMKILTYNIRYDSPHDGENRWELRKQFLVNQIKFHAPDIFGIQEGLHHQVQYIDSMLVDYQYVGVGRDDGKTKGEYSAIFYRSGVVHLISGSTFWLSETPEKISIGWDAALERICTYAQFKVGETNKKIWVFNTHLDHRGENARINSVDLILKKISEISGNTEPVLLTGDFNLEPDHQSIRFLSEKMKDSGVNCEEVCFGPEGTFNGFKFCEPVTRRIDYIFTSQNVSIKKYAVLSDSWELKYPSDHLPVFISIEL